MKVRIVAECLGEHVRFRGVFILGTGRRIDEFVEWPHPFLPRRQDHVELEGLEGGMRVERVAFRPDGITFVGSLGDVHS